MKAFSLLFVLVLIATTLTSVAQDTELLQRGIHLIPYPKEVSLQNGQFSFAGGVVLELDRNASPGDKFAAEELTMAFKTQWSINLSDRAAETKKIKLTRKNIPRGSNPEGYEITVTAEMIIVKGYAEAGLFYGVQSLIQLVVKSGETVQIPALVIKDWPDTKVRAAHYDTKHHQDTREYVEGLIRDLARYKMNMLVWEWEDKLAYESHQEIGAPGAFTVFEMQAFTRYAKQYHIELVPLVQGLGHVSFILKWPQHAALREIYASNFEFCPLKDSSYKLLFDLWDEAIKATPGSSYIHIGSDETYELGECEQCRSKAAEIGLSGLYHLFVGKAATYLQRSGRKVMVWESPMNWKQGDKVAKKIVPRKGLVLTESYNFETPDLAYAKEAKALGYPVFAYDPNPGIEPLFLPYFYRQSEENRERIEGSLENSYKFLKASLGQHVFDGVIRTSWDDSGVPVQGWMLQFITTAAFSWNTANPALPEFIVSFFKNYYGENENELAKFFYILNEGAYYYSETLERNVWHFGSIGKTHLPDLPRADNLEYDPYWNIRYADQVNKAQLFVLKMDTALAIASTNLGLSLKHSHDIEVFTAIAELFRHTAKTYLDLSALEHLITQAHNQRFLNHDSTVYYLQSAERLVKENIDRRNKLYDQIVKVWEVTRLPKGMSTPEKTYFFRQDRTRHYANRTADMKFLIVDEEDLDLEGYLRKLTHYRETYQANFMSLGAETLKAEWPSPR